MSVKGENRDNIGALIEGRSAHTVTGDSSGGPLLTGSMWMGWMGVGTFGWAWALKVEGGGIGSRRDQRIN